MICEHCRRKDCKREALRTRMFQYEQVPITEYREAVIECNRIADKIDWKAEALSLAQDVFSLVRTSHGADLVAKLEARVKKGPLWK